MKIGIIGAGKWGSAINFALTPHNPIVYSRSKKDIPNQRELDEVLRCEYLIFVIPAQITKRWLEENFVDYNQNILVATKGIHVESMSFMDDVFKKYVKSDKLCYLSGPSFASEVVKSLPTAVVINSQNEQLALKYASFFPPFMKTYTSSDVIGAEICGAYKNVLAIASGICEGLNLGNNARASLISRGLVEMQRFGLHFGAKEDTFLGLSGAGDLFLTASSTLSRNYRVGLELAKEKNLDEILNDLGEVAEGVDTARAIDILASKRDIYTPIAREVKKMLDGKKPKDSLKDLLSSGS